MKREMKKHGLVARMTLKRLFTRKSFWLILCLMPVFLFGLDALSKEEEDALRAVVYCPQQELTERLSEESNPGFYFVESVEEVKEQVLTGKAECGYVIPENLPESFREDDWYWQIEVYEGSHSMFTGLINEVLFSRIFELVSTDWYLQFAGEKLSIDSMQELQAVRDKLEEVFAKGETFQVQTIRLTDENIPGDEKESADRTAGDAQVSSRGMISAEGVVAVLLYLMSLLAVMDVARDREKGHFRKEIRPSAAFWTIWHPVVLVGIVGGAGLLLIFMTVVYALLLSLLVRKSEWMYGLTPVLFMAGLVCCPIFVDLGDFFPFFQWMKWLFPFGFCL